MLQVHLSQVPESSQGVTQHAMNMILRSAYLSDVLLQTVAVPSMSSYSRLMDASLPIEVPEL